MQKNVKGETITLKTYGKSGDTTFSINYDKFSEGLAIYWSDHKYKKGYVDRKGKPVIDQKYQEASPFQSGFAVVSQYDETGAIKWGVIDKAGKTIVPFQYSNKPGSFSSGFAHPGSGIVPG